MNLVLFPCKLLIEYEEISSLTFRRSNPCDYGSYGSGHDHDPLNRSKIQDEKGLIRELNIAQVFGDYSNDDISRAIARRRPDVGSTIGADDVKSILSPLKDNCECGNNNYAQLKELAAQKKVWEWKSGGRGGLERVGHLHRQGEGRSDITAIPRCS